MSERLELGRATTYASPDRERLSAAGDDAEAFASRAARRKPLAPVEEAPTWALLALTYGVWAGALWNHEWLGLPLFALLGTFSVAMHLSLQHEALHGHPTRSATVNEALVFMSLNGLIPYRRFRDTHLRHHRDEMLTDPLDDPESWYVAEIAAEKLSTPMRWLLRINSCVLGRLIVGPWLGVFGMLRADWREGGERIRNAYFQHAVAMLLVFGFVWGVCGMNPLIYLLVAVWPGMAIIMLRTYCEHRAVENVDERTIVVEAEPIFQLLFLNNNLHAVHHANPTVAWYRLPAIWRRDRERILERNGGYYVRGYRSIIGRWLVRAKEPLEHPFLHRR